GVEEADAGPDANPDAPPPKPTVVTLTPDAAPLPGESACKVVITTGIPVTAATHVPICTSVEYATNPPSGGDHWPVWAAFGKYTTEVPREMSVHDLEHGAVVVSYRCKDACPEVIKALGDVIDSSVDSFCATESPPITRAILTPDPAIPTPVAVAAWGATYVATCLDPASL